MTGRLWTLGVACSLLSLAACSSGKSETPTNQGPATPTIQITASKSTVVANGSNTVLLSVTNTGSGSVSVTTDRGTFQGGGTTASVSGAFGTATLVTCNSSTPGCAGTATITATGSAGTASTTVTFASLTAACLTNCAIDPGCVSLACTLASGGSGACSATTPSTCAAGTACTPNPPSATTETSCSDGIDNDCNGMKDCKDSACDGQPCLAGSPTFVCKAGACTDITSGLSVTVTPARTRLPADGTTTTEVVVDVASSGDPANLMTVSVSTDLGSITPAVAATGADGKARFTFTSSLAAGVATITAQLQAVPTVQGTALVTMPRLGALQLVTVSPGSVEFPVMGAIGSGWQEFGWVQIMAVDDIGLPYPDGLAVRFEHQTLGGSTLRGPLTPDTGTCLASAGCVGYLGVVSSGAGSPDTTGLANAWIYSGRVAGTLNVTATASAGGTTRTIQLPTIAVVGAKASGANFSIVCSPQNVPALARTDCSVSFVDAPFTCEAILKDRFSNVLGRSTQVIFAAEAGAVGQPTWTKTYDPTATGDKQMDLGIALETINTLGAGLPFDVDPITTIGEPSVVHALDGCGTRTHNPRDGVVTVIAIADGEEAFWDVNGNGSYDAGEPFIDQGEPFVDANDNGVWDPGEWFLDLDGNGTWTPPNGKWDANTKIWTQSFVVYTGTSVQLPGGAPGSYLGTRIADAVADACTPSLAPTPFSLAIGSPGESTTYAVVASDLNLNFLTSGTTYSTDVLPSSASATTAFNGLANFADETGMGWRYWPCDQTGACASQCRATGAAAPCLMRPEFTGFWCGYTSSITVTAGSTADSAVAARWNQDVPYGGFGGTVDALFRTSVPGSTH